MQLKARAIALHLPQFHPFPENDEWWGRGFTEWTNATKARPLFPGHYQPHLPADLGFYDLRLPEAREAQADLARQYGVEAFCFYHYWFGAGRRLLERPFQEIVELGKPDFPFLLCWANQTWTGIWHGAPGRILIEQRYPGREDYVAHFNALRSAFLDPRYLTISGRPVFVVYHPSGLPDALEFTDTWRELALKAGLPGLHLLAERNDDWDFRARGFDGCVQVRLPPKRREYVPWSNPGKRLLRTALNLLKLPTVHRYEQLLDYIVPDLCVRPARYPCVIPNWDNTPRSGPAGLVMHGSTPALFRAQVDRAVSFLADRPAEERLLFIKSWNEWGEGNHLEPDRRFGHGYLQALKDSLSGV